MSARRTSTAASLELPGILSPLPDAPASGTRATLGPYRFLMRLPGGEFVPVDVPRRDQGGWTREPRMVPHSDEATARAMRLHGERVAAEMSGGKRGGASGERPKADATKVRALLLDRGALDHHEVAAALGVTADSAKQVLTNLRNTGHIHKADDRKRPRTKAGDVGGSHTMGVWELTAQGRAATKRETRTGKRLSDYNAAGYRSNG